MAETSIQRISVCLLNFLIGKTLPESYGFLKPMENISKVGILFFLISLDNRQTELRLIRIISTVEKELRFSTLAYFFSLFFLLLVVVTLIFQYYGFFMEEN